MNWFERHLNWTAVIITFGGFLFTCLMGLFALGFSLFNPLNRMGHEFQIYLIIVICLCNTISIVMIAWVIKRKKRSLLFGLVFLLSFLSLGLVFYLSTKYSDSDTRNSLLPLIFAMFVSAYIWVTGLIVLLFLKNKNINLGATNETIDPNVLSGKNGFSVIFGKIRNKSLFTRIIIMFLLLTITVSSFSCFRMYHSYRIFSPVYFLWSQDKTINPPSFTMEYAENYYVPPDIVFDAHVKGGQELFLTKYQIQWFKLSSSDIIVTVLPSTKFYNSPNSPLFDTCIQYFYLSFDGRNIGSSLAITDLTITQIKVAGIPTEYATFILNNPDSVYYPPSENRLVCFEHEGYVWTIRMSIENKKTISQNRAFDHLLETFTITDN